jgi:predicted short-subunit dehydrogenase-like oxidoreductase (DUF2520 family)
VKSCEPLLIVGTGNLAAHLLPQLSVESGFNVYVTGSSSHKTADFIKVNGGSVFNPIEFADAGLPVILCVPDSEIQNAAAQIVGFASCIIHCSGSTDISVLKNYTGSAAVLWPVQTFTFGRNVSWKSIPLCTESTDQISRGFVSKISSILGGPVCELSSNQRQKLHLGAVVVNNFTNQLVVLAKSYCQQNDLDFKMLLPLLNETVSKLETLTPEQAQTGPARRGDRITIQKHLQLLKEHSSLKDLYLFMSEQIKQHYPLPE